MTRDIPVAGKGEPADQNIPDDLVEVGYVSGAWGVRGWLRVEPHSNDADALLQASTWWLQVVKQAGPGRLAVDSTQSMGAVKVMAVRPHSGSVVAQLRGISDRTLAEALKSHRVWIRRSDFPVPEEGEFYWVDLIGLEVKNTQGEVLGQVEGLLDNGVHQILRVVGDGVDAKGLAMRIERLIPFVDQYVQQVMPCQGDKPSGIVVDWGLDY